MGSNKTIILIYSNLEKDDTYHIEDSFEHEYIMHIIKDDPDLVDTIDSSDLIENTHLRIPRTIQNLKAGKYECVVATVPNHDNEDLVLVYEGAKALAEEIGFKVKVVYKEYSMYEVIKLCLTHTLDSEGVFFGSDGFVLSDKFSSQNLNDLGIEHEILDFELPKDKHIDVITKGFLQRPELFKGTKFDDGVFYGEHTLVHSSFRCWMDDSWSDDDDDRDRVYENAKFDDELFELYAKLYDETLTEEEISKLAEVIYTGMDYEGDWYEHYEYTTAYFHLEKFDEKYNEIIAARKSK